MKRDKDISSLEHTAWRCQYHIVFAPKYRRMEIYVAIREDTQEEVQQIIAELELQVKRLKERFSGKRAYSLRDTKEHDGEK